MRTVLPPARTPAILTALIAALVALAGLTLAAAPAVAQDTEVCRGHTDNALAACTRVIISRNSTREQVGDAYINRGQHYYEQKNNDKAIEDFNRAIPLKPKWLAMAYGNRGNAYYAKGEDDKAIDSYDKAIELEPKYTAALTARGLLYEKAGAIERAKADYEASLATNSIFEDNKWAHETARKHLDNLNQQATGNQQTPGSQQAPANRPAPADQPTAAGPRTPGDPMSK
jgi:tetratricopeptide (TPR) repeat protein